ncbi:MAG: hypothetical protein EBX95_11975 [Acidimicrobiia bacterium]|jgi:DNA polymerase processivity factor|nr:hypothetical protein [Acidimicrobiia bacterium]
MQISNETIAILKNFSTINSNIIFRPGNNIKTMSTAKNVFASATVAETFPREVAIYDLNSLLALLTLNDKCEVEFHEESLKISKNGGDFEYFYSDPRLVTAPPADKSIEVDNHFQFKLTADDVQTMQKAIAITASPNIFVTSKLNQVTLSIHDKKNAKANSYKKVIGPGFDDFNVFIGVDVFKIIPDAYTVTVSKKKFLHFKHETKPIEYWLACDPESTV